MPDAARGGEDPRRPEAEERRVHVARGVDAEAVDLVLANPAAEHRGKALHHDRLLREQVVEPEEVALLEAHLAARVEVDVAAVVVVRHVVQPCRLLHAALRGQDVRAQRHVLRRQARKRPRHVERGIEFPAPAVPICLLGRRDERGAAELDDVAGVVHDDVEVDLQAERVRTGHERGEVGVGAEMRIDAREVEAPVTVVAGTRSGVDLVLHRRRDPDRREPERLQTRQPLGRCSCPSAPCSRRRARSRDPPARNRSRGCSRSTRRGRSTCRRSRTGQAARSRCAATPATSNAEAVTERRALHRSAAPTRHRTLRQGPGQRRGVQPRTRSPGRDSSSHGKARYRARRRDRALAGAQARPTCPGERGCSRGNLGFPRASGAGHRCRDRRRGRWPC